MAVFVNLIRCILNPMDNWASSGLARAIKMH